jgi:hypothetical protein
MTGVSFPASMGAARVTGSSLVSFVASNRSRWRTNGDVANARTARSMPANRPSPLLSTSVPFAVSARAVRRRDRPGQLEDQVVALSLRVKSSWV